MLRALACRPRAYRSRGEDESTGAPFVRALQDIRARTAPRVKKKAGAARSTVSRARARARVSPRQLQHPAGASAERTSREERESGTHRESGVVAAVTKREREGESVNDAGVVRAIEEQSGAPDDC